jgi:hypothetical protein
VTLLLLPQAVDGVVGTAELEGSSHLEILALQKQAVGASFVEQSGFHYGRAVSRCRDAPAGRFYVFEGNHISRSGVHCLRLNIQGFRLTLILEP